jgi:hypothetical protein
MLLVYISSNPCTDMVYWVCPSLTDYFVVAKLAFFFLRCAVCLKILKSFSSAADYLQSATCTMYILHFLRASSKRPLLQEHDGKFNRELVLKHYLYCSHHS